MRIIIRVLVVSLSWMILFSDVSAHPNPNLSNTAQSHPLYLGVAAGLGSTVWDGLVPSARNQGPAMQTSTPVDVAEGGFVGGFVGGYEFSPFFAVEASYLRYPNAMVTFDEYSLFAYDHEGETKLYTHTETGSIMAKVMLNIPKTRLRFYSAAGVAEIHRWDMLNENLQLSPTFGVGFNYNITDHIMAEFMGSYTAGYGESEINPALDYVPFLYAGFFKLLYRI